MNATGDDEDRAEEARARRRRAGMNQGDGKVEGGSAVGQPCTGEVDDTDVSHALRHANDREGEVGGTRRCGLPLGMRKQ